VRISYSRGFTAQAKSLTPEQRRALRAAIELFDANPLHPVLRNHALKGKYKPFRSINVTPDVRALYLQKSHEAVFVAVGTHRQLYG
jgi:mRNA interferase YafQ